MKKRTKEIKLKWNNVRYVPDEVNVWNRGYEMSGLPRVRTCMSSTLKTIDGLIINVSYFTHGDFVGDPAEGKFVWKAKGYDCKITDASNKIITSCSLDKGDYFNTTDIDKAENLALELLKTIK